MGNAFVPNYSHSRTYQNFIPKSNCEVIAITTMTIENLKTVRAQLRKSRNLEIYLHQRSILRGLKRAIRTNPNICDVGYILFRTQRSVILKIVNQKVDPIFDAIGQKWFYLDFQLEPK